MPTYVEAIDDMFARVKAANDSSSEAIIGYVPEIRWRDLELPDKPGEKFWMRVNLQTVIDGQATLSTDEGLPGQRRYDTQGNIIIQLFAPKSVAGSGRKLDQLGELMRNTFRGAKTANGVWFRNSRIQDGIPAEDLYYRSNVISEFIFSENF